MYHSTLGLRVIKKKRHDAGSRVSGCDREEDAVVRSNISSIFELSRNSQLVVSSKTRFRLKVWDRVSVRKDRVPVRNWKVGSY